MTTLNLIQSRDSLLAGGDVVPADGGVHKNVARAAADLAGSRMDRRGGGNIPGLHSAVAAAIKAYLRTDEREASKAAATALGKVWKARAGQPEGRLDDATLGLTDDRIDATNTSAAVALARELEYVYNEVLREERPIRSAMRLFAVDRSVPAGAKTHTIRRMYGSGEFKFYRGGEEIPLVGIGRDEMSFKVAAAAAGLELDFFDEQADAYAGINQYALKVAELLDAADEFANLMAWRGSENHDVPGILTYPWLRKRKLATTLTSVSSAADFNTAKDLLQGIVNEIRDRYPGMGMELRVIVSPRIHRLMAQQENPETGKSLKERFLAGQPSISEIEEAPELQGAGPGGEDGFLVIPKGPRAPRIVMPKPLTMMPIQVSNYGFTRSQAGYMKFGGVVMRDVLRSVLCWIDVDY